MGLLDTYNTFRKTPSTAQLDSTAVCSYVTTGLHLKTPEAVVQHFVTRQHEVEVVNEQVIDSHETKDSLVLETETTIKFVRGPSAFLPGMSINFVADEQAVYYMIHIVRFGYNSKEDEAEEKEDQEPKIKSIRYTWDQASVLKQINVIGSRGNAWPIYHCKDQSLLAQGKHPEMTTQMLKQDGGFNPPPPTMRGWKASTALSSGHVAMDPVPVPAPAMEAPSPSKRPQHRTFQDMMEMSSNQPAQRMPAKGGRKPRPQSAYMTLLGGGDSNNQEYRRLVGAAPSNTRQVNSRPSWTIWGGGEEEEDRAK